MRRICNKILMMVLIIFCFSTIGSFAHSGRTDASGGHYDHSTGEYHYHHGYPAHQHENGVCPYEDNDGNYNVSGEYYEDYDIDDDKTETVDDCDDVDIENYEDHEVRYVLLLIVGYVIFLKVLQKIEEIKINKATEKAREEVDDDTLAEIESVIKEPNDVRCPKCGRVMKLRSGRYGLFYGCTNYPYCKGTRSIK